MSDAIVSPGAPEPVGPYPHARRAGNLLFLSGVGPRRPGYEQIPGVEVDVAGHVVGHDIETQCRATFENVRAILKDCGASWNSIVDVTVFLTDLKADFAVFNRVYGEYFAGPGKPNPARTTVEVRALPTPIAIELKVVAMLP